MHGLVRHPNIVQIIAIPVLKNAIYLLSELIKGPNLDDLLFSDDKINTHFTIQSYTKFHLGKHIYQAVAYLHNLKPPVVHRDIKPATILVDEGTQVIKLCEMGLRRFQSAQSISRTTSMGIPSTPSYMSLECVPERRKATNNSDVWSLQVTSLEPLTQAVELFCFYRTRIWLPERLSPHKLVFSIIFYSLTMNLWNLNS